MVAQAEFGVRFDGRFDGQSFEAEIEGEVRAVARGDAVPRGFRVFSESDEDGILLFLLASLGLGTQRFVDIGAYRDGFVWRRAPAGEPLGASPAAMTRLAERLGYRLVGGNRLGFNTIYVRDGLGDARIPTIVVEDLFRYDRSGRLDTPGPPA